MEIQEEETDILQQEPKQYPGFDQSDEHITGYKNYKVQINKFTTEQNIVNYKIHKFVVEFFENEEKQSEVYRRYSDFEWLYNQLKLVYMGFNIPPIPDKNKTLKFIDNNDELIKRQVQLQWFLTTLLNHQIFKQSRDLLNFLTILGNTDFEEYKKNSEYCKLIAEKGFGIKDTANSVAKQLVNWWKGGIEGQFENNEQLESIEQSQEFEGYIQHYNNEQVKLDKIFQCIKAVFQYKKQQADNLLEVKNIFDNLKQLNEGEIFGGDEDEQINEDSKQQQQKSLFDNVINQSDKVQKQQEINYQDLLLQFQYPLQSYVDFLTSCVTLLEDRKKKLDSIRDGKIQLAKNFSENDEQELFSQIRDFKVITENFKKDKSRFDNTINEGIKKIILDISKNQADCSSELLKIWSEDYKIQPNNVQQQQEEEEDI